MPVYYIITWLRNWLYNKQIFKSKTYSTAVICVGNLSVGGTGKTPLIAYLIKLLKNDFKVSTLSRGYKRRSSGFVLANVNSTVEELGDEPFLLYSKFKNLIQVAVDANRQRGISSLLAKTKTNLILLDDAYQHRKVSARLTILLTKYSNLFYNDWVLPTGNLREPRQGYKRADFILVTKCPENLPDTEQQQIVKSINPKAHQKVFFTTIAYDSNVYTETTQKPLKAIKECALVTGIADAKPLLNYLKRQGVKFQHFNFPDHHEFTVNDIFKFINFEYILTTEKDYVKLKNFPELHLKLMYLPIQTRFLNNSEVVFNKDILRLLKV